MTSAKIIFTSILALSVICCCGQVISRVNITGLSRTKEDFLREYIVSKAGTEYDSLKADLDAQRLKNLSILGDVRVSTERVESEELVLTFHCVEMINSLPVFALGSTHDTFWCKAGMQSLNLTGRADKLFAYYQYYDRHSVYLNYATDRIAQAPWGLTASLIRWATIEPLRLKGNVVTYNYDNTTSYVSAVRFFSFRETLEVGLGYFHERFTSREDGGAEVANIVQGNKLLSKVIFKSNHLDFNSFYVNGFFNQLNVEFIHAAAEIQNFFIAFNDLRFYKIFGSRLNWASRLRTGIATNAPNPFAPFVLDSYLNLRGVGNRVDRGTGSVVVNSEMRYTLIDKKILAAQAVSFIDFGSWRKPGGNFSDFKKSENMKAFGGVGFRLIYKRAFDTMLRVDYGYDYDKNKGLVVGIGQYF